jgi:hypothetical protein
MIITIILLLLTGFGIYLSIESYDYDILGRVMAFIFGIWLLLSSYCLLTVSYHHELFVVKRDAFENTLKNVRKNGNEYETFAIATEVAKWNTRLAEDKYDNTTWFYDQYIDDRINTLEPIE